MEPFIGWLPHEVMEPPATISRVSVTPMCRFRAAPYSPSTLLSGAWLVHGMTMSHGTTKSLPGMASAVRRPDASGGPSWVRWKTTPFTRPWSSDRISTGAAKYSKRTPSNRVSCCSSSSTTISSGPRR